MDPHSESDYAYEEYDLGSETVVMIQRVDNEHAWIQSSVTEPVRR
ncbi:MAG: hypothetical protein ABEI57_03805 [Halapricum sp.]